MERRDVGQTPARIGRERGPSLAAVFDLTPPEGRDHERFETDLSDLLELVFERYCPARPDDPPLATANEVARALARGWMEVWFPPGERPASVAPLISHPWVKVEPGYWPFPLSTEAGEAVEVACYPQDDERRSERPCWIRVVGGGPPLVEMRLKPGKSRAGRVHLDLHLACDLFRVDAQTPEDAFARHAEHALAAWGQIEDLRALYPPAWFEVRGLDEGTSGRSLGAVHEAVGARLLARIEEALAAPPWPRRTRLLGLYSRWVQELSQRHGDAPALVNARDALRRGAFDPDAPSASPRAEFF